MKVFRAPGFLDAETCRRVRAAMDAGQPEPAEVLRDTISRDGTVRRATDIDVDPGVVAEIEQRLDRQRTAVETFFDVALAEREGPGFLRYSDGDFYRPHRDRGTIASWPGAARRRVAVVVFLNSSREANGRGDFDGGVLQLDVDGDPIDIAPQEGLLVAFDAGVLHQVTIVRGGTRDSIVDWFY